MLLHDARRAARFGGQDGQDLILLADQDRSLWDWPRIAEGRAILEEITARGGSVAIAPDGVRAPAASGPYTLQAQIASLQLAADIDWPQVAARYAELADLTGSPVVRLNAAIAIAETDGPAAALAAVDGLDLPGYQYWQAARAELLRRLGRAAEARAAYQAALALAVSVPERRFLANRIADC